jgi:ribosomal-protein-alanine N-acetyltransferase
MVTIRRTDDGFVVRTARTLLRPWRDADAAPFARLNADPEVMRYFENPLTQPESDRLAVQLAEHVRRHGFGFWAFEIPGVAEFAGFVGLAHVPITAPFTPAVELGWRLQRSLWGCGYASEGAKAAAAFGFGTLGLGELVASTVPANTRSRAVMERIGMTRDERGDFDHPSVSDGHPLRRQVLYRMSRAAWRG